MATIFFIVEYLRQNYTAGLVLTQIVFEYSLVEGNTRKTALPLEVNILYSLQRHKKKPNKNSAFIE